MLSKRGVLSIADNVYHQILALQEVCFMSQAETIPPVAAAYDPLGTTNMDARVHAIMPLTQQLTYLISPKNALLKHRRASVLWEAEAQKQPVCRPSMPPESAR